MLDFDSWIGSFVVVLLMISLITGFGAIVTWLIRRIFGEESDVAERPRMSRPPEAPPLHKAA